MIHWRVCFQHYLHDSVYILTIGLDCGIPPDPDFGHVTVTGTNVGSQANYVCDIGYEITKGDNPRTCQSDYTWSGVPAVCERKGP